MEIKPNVIFEILIDRARFSQKRPKNMLKIKQNRLETACFCDF